MESLEISAKTVEEAIQRALEQLGVSREEVEVTVVKEGRPGILGLGSEEAVVRVKPLVPVPKSDIVEAAKDALETLLALMGVDGSIVPQAQPIVEGEKEDDVVEEVRVGYILGEELIRAALVKVAGKKKEDDVAEEIDKAKN